MARYYEILDADVCHDGFFRLVRYRLRHLLFDGGLSETLTREVFERGHSVGVLPFDAERQEVALVEQFRPGALEAPLGPWVMDVIAGIIEPEETPLEVARREAVEEADCVVQELTPICRYLVSPGGTSEQVSLYCARADTAALGGTHGRPDEGEDIRVHALTLDEALARVADGTIRASMAIIALQWLALNRERMTALWAVT